MKKLLFIIMLLPVFVFGQLNKDSIIWTNKPNENLTLFVGKPVFKHQLIINGSNGKQLYFDFNGDSLKVSGDLKMNEAALKFIEFAKQQYPKEIFRLNSDSTEIIFNNIVYSKDKRPIKN